MFLPCPPDSRHRRRVSEGTPRIAQVAALPYRIDPSGEVEVLLATSRETRRWILPKGNVDSGLTPHEAAALEAWEEAGVRGTTCPTPIGRYRYLKRRRIRPSRELEVLVFPLAVQAEADDFPERAERTTRWFPLGEAAAAVAEPQLRAIIARFRVPSAPPGITKRLPAFQQRLSERLPMLRWFHALMPKQGRFFEQFEAHAATLVAGADALSRLLQGGGDTAVHIAEIVRREHEADDITRDVLQDVRRIFVTPFDRSAITDLIGVMDDAIDQMNQTATSITLYEVTQFEPCMRDMAGIIVEAARVTAEAIPLLRNLGQNSQRLTELTGRLIEIEGHADKIYDAGLKALYHRHKDGSNPMGFIVGQDIFAHLERVVDKFEDVANEVQGLVIDHA